MSFSTQFLAGLGPLYILTFVGLTAATLHQLAVARGHANHALDRASEILEGYELRAEPLLAQLAAMSAASDRGRLALSSIPSVALLGTTTGMYLALTSVGASGLGGGDSLALLQSLMDNGVSTALATTVAGQALYILLGQVWSYLLASPSAAARTHGDEALAQLRGAPEPLRARSGAARSEP